MSDDDQGPRYRRGSAAGADCENCPFAVDGKPNHPVFGIGPDDPAWIVVGEGPGAQETRQLVPFVGPTGQLVNQAFKETRTDRARLWVTNATLCLDRRTLVRMADGSAVRVDALVKRRQRVWVPTVTDHGRVSVARLVGWYTSPRGTRRVLHLTHAAADWAGNRGRERTLLTEDHTVLTPNGWVAARDVAGGLVATGQYSLDARGRRLLLGALLGDATITPRGELRLGHALGQTTYLRHKVRALSVLGGWGRGMTIVEQTRLHPFTTASSAQLYMLKELRGLIYDGDSGRRTFDRFPMADLDESSFAVWYLDDGYLSDRSATGRQPRAEIATTTKPRWLLDAAVAQLARRGVEAYVHDGRLRFGVAAAAKFSKLIARFVPPALQYKLHPDARGHFNEAAYTPAEAVPYFARAVTREVKPERNTVYCLEVEGTHNFFTTAAVVHNCEPRGADRSEKVRLAAAAACNGRLRAELADFPGRGVLAMGNVAAKTLVGDVTRLPITEITGSHFEHDLDGTGSRDIIPTVHPAAILRGGGKEGKGDKGPEKTGGHVADLAFWSLKWDILKIRALAESGELFPGVPVRLPMRIGQEIEIELANRARARWLVQRVLEAARRSGRLAIDYETYVDDPERNSALQAFTARIRLLGLASEGKAVSVLWDLLDDKTITAYRRAVANPSIVKEYHNGGVYDRAVHGNWRHGFVDGGEYQDTMLMQHAAWPGAKRKLQHVVSQWFAVGPWKSEFRAQGEDDLEAEAIYNAKDVLATHSVVGPLTFWVKRNKVEKVYEVDRVKAHVAAIMHSKGYYVCPEVNREITNRLTTVIDSSNAAMTARCDELKDKFYQKLAAEQAKNQRKADSADYVTRIRAREEELRAKVAKGKFQFRPSNDWHAVAFLRAVGVPLWKTTKTGRTQTSGDVLESFSDHDEVANLIALRANEQLLETFVQRMFNWKLDSQKVWQPPFVQDDGRCHPLWSPTQISGRFGSKTPASSNWSQGDETEPDPAKRLPNVRRQLIAPPGRGIVAFDLEQLEARLMAVQSGDPFLCRVFAEGKDIHHEFGLLIFPQMATLDKKSEEYKRLRDLTKRFEYGAIYGAADHVVHKAVSAAEPSLAGAKGLAMVQAAIRKLKQAVAGVFAWQMRLLQQTSIPPYTLRSYLNGRMRVFPLGNPPPTDVANNPNQFAGADVIDNGLVRFMPRLDKYKGTAFPFLHQHDALYIECNEDDMLRVARDVQETFPSEITAVNGQVIQFPIELKIGFAYHSEPSDKQKAEHPQLVWPVGRPGLVKLKPSELVGVA